MMMMTLERRCSLAGSRQLHCPWGAQPQDGSRRRWREAPLLKVVTLLFSLLSPIGAQEVTMFIFGSLPFSVLSLTPNTFKQTSLNQARASNIFCKMVILISCFSLRWVAHHLRPPADPGLAGADPGHAPTLPHLLNPSGPGTDILIASSTWKQPSHIPDNWSY